MRCPECNHLNIDTALACPYCGRAVSSREVDSGPCLDAVCDCCGAPMRPGREMCDACERAFSSVLGKHALPAADLSREPETVPTSAVPAVPHHEDPPVPEAPPTFEPWWKAQRRQPPPAPPSLPRASAGRPNPAAPANPATVQAAVRSTPVRPTPPSRPAEPMRSGRVTRSSRRLVRPAFAAAAAVAAAVVLGVPAGYELGLLPFGSLETSPKSVLPARDLAVWPTDGAPVVPARTPSIGGAALHPDASATPTPLTSTTRRSRRAAKPVTPKDPPRSETPPPAPVAEPLPVSPMVQASVLASAVPLVAAARADAVLAGPALEPSQVDVRPEVQSRVAPRLPSHLDGRRVDDVVVLRVLVLPTGQASDVRVLRTSKVDPSLDVAAIDAVRQWQFSPARRGGRAVSCWFSVGVPLRSE